MQVAIGDHQIEFGSRRMRLRADDAPPADYFPHRCAMERVVIVGDVPA